MEILLALTLPREALTVPVARHIVRNAMEEVGVDAGCIHDVELALSEACSNVLRHAGPGDEYDVHLDVTDERCRIRVVDVGHGLDSVQRGRLAESRRPRAGPKAERGRGLALMRAYVDRVRLASWAEVGTIVTLEKSLVYADQALLGGPRRRLAATRKQV